MPAINLAKIAQLWALGPSGWLDVFRAIGELARANWQLRSRPIHEIPLRQAEEPEAASMPGLDDAQLRQAQRIAFIIPRVAARMPWRADCLVQALAAKRWLSRWGIPSSLDLGVCTLENGDFGAHAWLQAGGMIITGGEIDQFSGFDEPADDRTGLTHGT